MKWRQWIFTFVMGGLLSLAPQEVNASLQDVLAKVTMRAQMSKTDVILITYRGHPIYIYGDDKRLLPIETRSVTKSFVCLVIGMLLQEEKICSLDTPVFAYYPEWKQGLKKQITIRQLLNHTSGLTWESGTELYEAPDSVKLALAADVCHVPGTHFIYNNKAVNLLSGIVEKASGMRLQDYVKTRLFQPLGITSDTWLSDAAGNSYGMSHLSINAIDLAKVGRLISTSGCWNGKRLLAKEWIEAFSAPSQSCNPFYGLLWWLDYEKLNIWWDQDLLNAYCKEGVSVTYVKALQRLNGQVFTLAGPISYGNFYQSCARQLSPYFEDTQEIYRFIAQVEGKGLPLARFDEGVMHSFSARGFLGQQLVILPKEDLVAVRLAKNCGQTGAQLDTLVDFETLLEEVACEIQACPKSIEYIDLTTSVR